MVAAVSFDEITRLLDRLASAKDMSPVVLKTANGTTSIEVAGVFGQKADAAAETNARVIAFISDCVCDASGSGAAQKAEAMLREASGQGGLTAAGCREVLERFSVPERDVEALELFTGQIAESALQSVQFASLPMAVRVAVMHGYKKGLEMLEGVVGLTEAEENGITPQCGLLSLDTLKLAQKTLGATVIAWCNAMRDSLPAGMRQEYQTTVLHAVRTLLQKSKPKLLVAFLDALTLGPLADVHVIQLANSKEFAQFDAAYPLPGGMDGKGPARRVALLREMLFETACRHIRFQKGLSVERLIREAANMLLHTNAPLSLASLQKLYLNSLLRDLPAVEDLRARASVKGFDAEGFHGDFVRDCIARRFSFTAEGFGKLENAIDREQAVARGKRDMEFFEQQKEALAQKMDGTANGAAADGSMDWRSPEVRGSVAMTEEDLNKGREIVMLAIPDRELRMAVTVLTNAAALALFEALFCKDPASGMELLGNHKHMETVYIPADQALRVKAMLYHDGARSMERHGEGDSEIPFGQISFTQFEYCLWLKQRSRKGNKEWQVNRVVVDSIQPFFVPAHLDAEPGDKNASGGQRG